MRPPSNNRQQNDPNMPSPTHVMTSAIGGRLLNDEGVHPAAFARGTESYRNTYGNNSDANNEDDDENDDNNNKDKQEKRRKSEDVNNDDNDDDDDEDYDDADFSSSSSDEDVVHVAARKTKKTRSIDTTRQGLKDTDEDDDSVYNGLQKPMEQMTASGRHKKKDTLKSMTNTKRTSSSNMVRSMNDYEQQLHLLRQGMQSSSQN